MIEPRIDRKYYSGSVLAPWPNRIADGEYRYEGKTYRAPINETSRHNALHGLVYEKLWDIVQQKSNLIILRTNVENDLAYPTRLELLMTYRLTKNGLLAELKATNIGDATAPYGASTHPYL